MGIFFCMFRVVKLLQMSTIKCRSYLPISKARAFLFRILIQMRLLSTDMAIWIYAVLDKYFPKRNYWGIYVTLLGRIIVNENVVRPCMYFPHFWQDLFLSVFQYFFIEKNYSFFYFNSTHLCSTLLLGTCFRHSFDFGNIFTILIFITECVLLFAKYNQQFGGKVCL